MCAIDALNVALSLLCFCLLGKVQPLKRKASATEVLTTTLVAVMQAKIAECAHRPASIRGPAQAARCLSIDDEDSEQWLLKARNAAIAGSCPRSHAELRSGVRAYCAFANKVNMLALPPTIDMLLAWSSLFRCSGTFKNYLTHVRTACQLVGFDTGATYDRLLVKAVNAIDKRRGYIPRPVMFLGIDIVRQMMVSSSASNEPKTRAIAMAFLTSYVFLLRMPSEGLPLCVATGLAEDLTLQSVATVTADALSLRLRRRKNKEGGSVLVRKCWCKQCKLTCPVHVLGLYFVACGAGSQPFAFFHARSALGILRSWLKVMGVKDASFYRTHDFRRGHARDMLRAGARLHEILRAGEWRSAAFLKYLDKVELECEATLLDHVNESSDEEVER